MMAVLYAIGLVCSIYLVATEPTDSWFFAYGVAFTVLNVMGVIRHGSGWSE